MLSVISETGGANIAGLYQLSDMFVNTFVDELTPAAREVFDAAVGDLYFDYLAFVDETGRVEDHRAGIEEIISDEIRHITGETSPLTSDNRAKSEIILLLMLLVLMGLFGYVGLGLFADFKNLRKKVELMLIANQQAAAESVRDSTRWEALRNYASTIGENLSDAVEGLFSGDAGAVVSESVQVVKNTVTMEPDSILESYHDSTTRNTNEDAYDIRAQASVFMLISFVLLLFVLVTSYFIYKNPDKQHLNVTVDFIKWSAPKFRSMFKNPMQKPSPSRQPLARARSPQRSASPSPSPSPSPFAPSLSGSPSPSRSPSPFAPSLSGSPSPSRSPLPSSPSRSRSRSTTVPISRTTKKATTPVAEQTTYIPRNVASRSKLPLERSEYDRLVLDKDKFTRHFKFRKPYEKMLKDLGMPFKIGSTNIPISEMFDTLQPTLLKEIGYSLWTKACNKK